jgi:hypothetical protein
MPLSFYQFPCIGKLALLDKEVYRHHGGKTKAAIALLSSAKCMCLRRDQDEVESWPKKKMRGRGGKNNFTIVIQQIWHFC